MASSLIFEGNVQVHLYGQNALIPSSLHDQLLTAVIGAEGSELIVNEHRTRTIQAIKSALPNGYPDGFLGAFNEQAWAEIFYEPNRKALSIDLYDTSNEVNIPILWMGVLKDNLMPNYEVEWEVLKPVDDSNTAFCALLRTQPVLPSDQLSLVSSSDEEAWSPK
jgi:hypothetical protein